AGRLDDTTHLAALSRELAANDWQERDNHDARRGTLADRNVELLVAAPFDVFRSTSGHDSTGSHGSTLAATGGGRREALVAAALLAGATVAGIASRGGAGGHRASTE